MNKKDLDYLYYKLGMKYYKKIHPNHFYKRNLDTTFETKDYNELVSILNEIYTSFNLSEHYFKILINDYPQSPYYEDSKTKIKLLREQKLNVQLATGVYFVTIITDSGKIYTEKLIIK